MKKLFVCLLLVSAANLCQAQSFSRYIIKFKNKATSPFSFSTPLAYLSQRAIDRRTTYGISLDSTDLPVTPRFIDSVRLSGAVTILNVSRWLNQVSILTTDAAALNKINSFSFVQKVAPIAARLSIGSEKTEKENLTAKTTDQSNALKTVADFYNYGASYQQVHIHNGEFLHNIGLRGQGMIIAVLDAGFRSYTSLRSFDSVNINGQVLGTYDFVARENSVTEDDSHGMQCFSVIAANIPGQFVGTAPKASFYLFRSEDPASEYPIEEHNWVCAAERTDSAGGDVISSSLGYNTFDDSSFDYTYADMNGNTTTVTIGADMAAKKGILVVNSAGNEGARSWGKIVAPADGDSVMAVGAVSTAGVPANFTSRGPSSDGQVKPDVSSVGVQTVVQTTANTIGTNNGTSFSCPNMAGLATCLWQGFKEYNNIKILRALQQAGNRFTTPNDTTGYGIPDVKKATLVLLKDFSTATINASACKNTIAFTTKAIAGMKFEVERKTSTETNFSKVGEVAATGNTFSARSYQFADSLINVQAGNIMYRIRQVIDTSVAGFSADYIDTLTINLTSACAVTTAVNTVTVNGNQLLLIPNPAKDRFIIRVTTTNAVHNLQFRITDNRGRIISSFQKNKAAGTANFEITSLHLAAGKYYVSVFNGDQLIATEELISL